MHVKGIGIVMETEHEFDKPGADLLKGGEGGGTVTAAGTAGTAGDGNGRVSGSSASVAAG